MRIASVIVLSFVTVAAHAEWHAQRIQAAGYQLDHRSISFGTGYTAGQATGHRAFTQASKQRRRGLNLLEDLGFGSWANDINYSETVVGRIRTASGQSLAGFWTGAAFTAITDGEATIINNVGMISGKRSNGDLFFYHSGVLTPIDRLPNTEQSEWINQTQVGVTDSGMVVGTAVTADGSVRTGWLWSATEGIVRLPGLWPVDVSEVGVILNSDGYLYNRNTLLRYSHVAYPTSITGVGHNEMILGRHTNMEWAVYKNGTLTGIEADLEGEDRGWSINHCYVMNGAQIVGVGTSPTGTVWNIAIHPVPEPSALAAFAAGLGVLWLRRPKRT
ncbi:MAG TPA: PEP-CTERM sorting domain-containing protein [Fimbriimonadaceae bacterium]|nr:PEP-CTERM sorting domain-containing protein [Fimbriimonadaceae bacterium]